MKSIVFFCASALLLSVADATKCYVCSTLLTSDCEDPSPDDTALIGECEGKCVVSKVGDEVGRNCWSAVLDVFNEDIQDLFDGFECTEKGEKNGDTSYACCDSDLCNGSIATSILSYWLFISTALTILLFSF